MARREFIGAGILAGLGTWSGVAFAADDRAGSKSYNRNGDVKFCVFADIHYKPHGFPHGSKEWLKRILNHAVAEKCDFIIHCGDFVHSPKRDSDYVDFYNDFKIIPTYHVIGNHDDDGNTHEETLAAYRMERAHYHFDCKGFRFIVLDPNHIRRADGSIEHYSMGNYYKKGSTDVIGVVPEEHLKWLKRTIDDSHDPCILLSHQSLERPVGNACANNAEVRAVIDAANAATPGKVRMAINGHHHCDYVRVLKNVVYFDLNSASFYWMGSKYAHRHYPDSYFAEHGITPRKVGWVAVDDPIHAIVRLTGDGRIRVEGSHSRFAFGVTPEMCGFRKDPCGRFIPPCVQSFEMNFDY